MFKLKLTTLTAILFLSYSSLADINLKLKGGFDFQGCYEKDNGTPTQALASANKKHLAFNSAGHINLELEKEIADFVEYGGKINLETTSRNNRRIASFIYLLSDYGKIELGSDKSATTKMKIHGYSVSAATAGAWDAWVTFSQNPTKTAYITNFSNFLDAKTRDGKKVEYSRKISYFSPKLGGFQLGVSYIPDTTNTGYSPHSEAQTHQLNKPGAHTFAITDGFGYGISYGQEFAEKEGEFKVAAVGEQGKTKAFLKGVPVAENFSNLKTYTIGSEVRYASYAFAVSYTNYLKSLTSPDLDKLGRNGYVYGAGLSYKHGKLTSSLAYLYSSYKKNNLGATTLAMDYKLAKGVMPYGEITCFMTNGKYLGTNQNLLKEKTKGVVLLTGLKIEF